MKGEIDTKVSKNKFAIPHFQLIHAFILIDLERPDGRHSANDQCKSCLDQLIAWPQKKSAIFASDYARSPAGEGRMGHVRLFSIRFEGVASYLRCHFKFYLLRVGKNEWSYLKYFQGA